MMAQDVLDKLVERAKTRLRIRHDKLDGEIMSTVEAAGLAMRKAGVSEQHLNLPDKLTAEAILTYVQYKMAESGNEQFFESWQYQVDCIRRHREETSDDERYSDPSEN